ncbi:Serotype-specific antigen [Trichinella spiralis]|uniref:Serotype-specific antigen n=1 Tax=Trichinella spiralis TaxID=6334 RepID=A0ABR3KEQ7_TRISP
MPHAKAEKGIAAAVTLSRDQPATLVFSRSRGGPTKLSQVQRRYQLRKGFVQGDFECFFYFPELSKKFTTGFLLSRQQRSGLFSHHHGCQYNWNPTDLDCKATGPSVEGDRR